jgi:DNA polymerase V
MIESLTLELVDKNLVCDQIVLTVGYDIDNLNNNQYTGITTLDKYGRKIPKHAHGTANLKFPTSSLKLVSEAVLQLYERIINKKLLIRRLNLSANHLQNVQDNTKQFHEQLDLFSCQEVSKESHEKQKKDLEEELRLQKAIIDIKKKFGKNSVLKAMDLQEGATSKDRNNQIGGHNA